MQALAYMPVTYRRRQTQALTAFCTAVVFAVAAVGFDKYLATPPVGQGIVAIQILLVVVFLFVALLGLAGKITYECRIEGDQLVLVNPRFGERAIVIDEIVEIVSVSGLGDTASWFEINIRDVGRLKVEYPAMSPLAPLKERLKAINPGIRFTGRNSDRCHACLGPIWPVGVPFTFRSAARFSAGGKCGSCGAAVPRYDQFVQPVKPSVR
jgi:hypothetical protein